MYSYPYQQVVVGCDPYKNNAVAPLGTYSSTIPTETNSKSLKNIKFAWQILPYQIL